MEHLLFHLVIETIQALDRRLQKPLPKVIPDLPLLRADPRGYLNHTPVHIGPKKRHALAAVLGLFSAIVVTALLIFVMDQIARPKKPDLNRIAGVIATFVAVFLVVRHYCMKWLTGGEMNLKASGVELIHRDTVLFLPWELFRVSGSVFEPDPKVAVIPIDPAVPVALSGADGEVTAILPEELEAPQATSSEFAQLAIKDQYEVRVGELAALILHLGEQLNEGEAVTSFTGAAAPLAMPDTDGSLRIHLTQLPFPPICFGCGSPTHEVMEVSVSQKKQRNKIEVPYCRTCAAARRQRMTRGALIGVILGLLSGIALAYFVSRQGRDFELFIILAMIFAVGFAIPFGAIGLLIARDFQAPFALRSYQPEKGTIKLHLRDPRRSANLLQAMGLEISAAQMATDGS